MTGSFRKWLLSAFLLSALAFVGAPSAQAQYRRWLYEPRPGTRADRLQDRQQLRILQDRIRRDKEQLRADIRRFGKHSFQVRADREQLRRDEFALKQLRRDMKRDHWLMQRRNFRGRW